MIKKEYELTSAKSQDKFFGKILDEVMSLYR